ncbi:MAG: hypothetical protein Q7R32_05520 [Dehalococcoidia bacterium]|nr:hypothetical protein [Dehalococcoidia bacterium]
MTKELKYDQLNRCIDGIISTGEFASTGDEGVDALARLAAGLRGLPTPDFKAGLGAELLPKPGRPAWRSFPRRFGSALPESRPAMQASRGGLMARVRGLPALPWLRRNRPFAAAGGSCGLLAGTCCISGAVASVFGLASAAAVSAFIDNSLPYFVAASIAGLAAWLVVRVVREQGLTPATLVATVRRHGIAMGSAYGAVFGASMGLAMALGLY